MPAAGIGGEYLHGDLRAALSFAKSSIEHTDIIAATVESQ
jgi:hypothetical protein